MALCAVVATLGCSGQAPPTIPAFALPDAATAPADTAPAPDAAAEALTDQATEPDTLAVPEVALDVAAVDSKATGDVVADAAPAPDVATNPCTGVTCSGKGECSPLFGEALCKCNLGYHLVGTTACVADAVTGPCFPNPCAKPDKGICSVAGADAVCSCAPGFQPDGDVCLFATCPNLTARTGITVFDQTGAGIAAGFDPLVAGDVVRLVVDIEVVAGTAGVTLELHPYNLTFDLARLVFDGNKVLDAKKKGPVLSVPVALTPGLHRVELLATLLSNQAPLGLNVRLAAPGACEVPGSRSAARIGALGVLDAKGFECIDLDRSRSVQVTHDVVEKNTADYGAANGTLAAYQPVASIVSTVTPCFVRQQADLALFLAGDARGLLPWAVDNFLVIERYDAPPQPGDKPVQVLWAQGQGSIASTLGVPMQAAPPGDVPGTHFGIPNGSPFGWSPGHVRLDDLVPPGKLVWLRFIALDHGVVGRLTRLYVQVRPLAETPRRCLANSHCVASNGGAGKGCVDGQCTGVPCGATACPANQFCVGGLCTSRCDQGGGSCGAGLVCKARACAPAAQAGTCEASQKDQDCPQGQTCHDGRCEPGCHHPRKQDQSYAQDSGFCQGAKPALCPHCPKAVDGCWNNVCAQCEVDGHCQGGQICVGGACVVP